MFQMSMKLRCAPFPFGERVPLWRLIAASLVLALADVNGDGRLDVVTANAGSANVSVLLHQSYCAAATASVQFPRLGNRHRYPVTEVIARSVENEQAALCS
jgi:hypothetical protein